MVGKGATGDDYKLTRVDQKSDLGRPGCNSEVAVDKPVDLGCVGKSWR